MATIVKRGKTYYVVYLYTNEHDECRQDDRPSVGGQHGPTMGVLIDGALSHEDRIVVTLTKDERAQNDINDIELDAQQRHDS